MQIPARPPRSRGFSLVEVLIAVGVILVILAIAVPSLLRARMKASESAAVANMRAIITAEFMYYTAYPQVGYAGNLVDLGSHGSNCEAPGETNSCLIMDESLTSGLKGSYTFDLLGDGQVPSQAYTLTALPEPRGTSGGCAFKANQSGVIYAESTGGGGKFSLATSPCDPPGSVAPAR